MDLCVFLFWMFFFGITCMADKTAFLLGLEAERIQEVVIYRYTRDGFRHLQGALSSAGSGLA